jgi:archaellum component FlaC
MQPTEEQLEKIMKTVGGLESDFKEITYSIEDLKSGQKTIENLISAIALKINEESKTKCE